MSPLLHCWGYRWLHPTFYVDTKELASSPHISTANALAPLSLRPWPRPHYLFSLSVCSSSFGRGSFLPSGPSLAHILTHSKQFYAVTSPLWLILTNFTGINENVIRTSWRNCLLDELRGSSVSVALAGQGLREKPWHRALESKAGHCSAPRHLLIS